MLEAAIIISVLLGLLDKLNAAHLKRYVWFGAGSAFAICVAGAVLVLVLVNVVKSELLEGDSEILVEGIVGLVAAVLIGYVALSMGNILGLHNKIEARIQANVDASEEAGVTSNMIFFLAFTAVAREGLETIIFFVGIGANYPSESLPLPALLGAVIGGICGVALYRFGGHLTMERFFKVMMLLLVLIGAGVWTNAIHDLQEYGSFGVWEPVEDRPPLNKEIFDISDCCGLDNQFWVLMRVLFGYQPTPSPLEFLMYALYVGSVILLIVVRYKRAKAGKPPLKRAIKDWCKVTYARILGKHLPESESALTNEGAPEELKSNRGSSSSSSDDSLEA